MLDKQVFKNEFNKLLTLYPNWKVDVGDSQKALIWYEQFQHMDNERFSYMVNQHVKHEKFNPTVTTLLEHDTIPRKSRDQIEHEKMLKENGLL